jgi:hypothetical protein
MHVNEVVAHVQNASSDGAPAPIRDLTNGDPGVDSLGTGGAYRITARCTDTRGNSYEVEFSMRFAMF